MHVFVRVNADVMYGLDWDNVSVVCRLYSVDVKAASGLERVNASVMKGLEWDNVNDMQGLYWVNVSAVYRLDLMLGLCKA